MILILLSLSCVSGGRKDRALTVTICNAFSGIGNFYVTIRMGYGILQKRIAVLQIVTSTLFCIYPPKKTVASLIVICFFREKPRDVREGMLGMTTVELAKKLNLAQPTISQAAMRGRKIAEEEGLKIESMTGKEGK